MMHGLWAWLVGFSFYGCWKLGTLSLLFGSMCLVSLWTFHLGIDMDFIILSFFYMSTRDFVGDGHLFLLVFRLCHPVGGSISPFGGTEPHSTFCCT